MRLVAKQYAFHDGTKHIDQVELAPPDAEESRWETVDVRALEYGIVVVVWREVAPPPNP